MTKGRNNRADYHTRRVIEDELREHLSTTVENEDRDQQLVAYKDGSSDSHGGEDRRGDGGQARHAHQRVVRAPALLWPPAPRPARSHRHRRRKHPLRRLLAWMM
jgi:hypothetical protein